MTTHNTLTLNSKTYKAEPATMTATHIDGKAYPSCHGCAFYEELLSCDEVKITCVAEYRPDNRNIIWIEEK